MRARGKRSRKRARVARVRAEPGRAIEHRVAYAIATAGALGETIRTIIQIFCEATGWVGGAFWRFDTDSQTLHCEETWGANDRTVKAFIAARAMLSPLAIDGDALLGAAWATGKPTSIRADRAPCSPNGAATRAALRGVFALPMKVGTRRVGLLEFFGREPCNLDPDLLACAKQVGGMLGEFCERKRTEEELLRFRAAIDTSGDSIYLIDPVTLRFIDFNDTACLRTGYSREELLTLCVNDVAQSDPEDLRRWYAAVIANPEERFTRETLGRAKDGREAIVEVYPRAVRSGDKWVIVSVSRDITERKQAERANVRLARLYAMLNATNEAILHADSSAALYQKTCDAAVHGGKFATAAIVLADAATGSARVAAVAGTDEPMLRGATISVDESLPEGRGLIGTAFRTLQAAISRELSADDRASPWRPLVERAGWTEAAAIPLQQRGRAVGVLFLLSRRRKAFDAETVQLLERMAENVGFALDNFEREAERQRAEQALRSSEERYRTILETMSDGYFEVDLEGNYTFFNAATMRMHGYTRDELMGLNYKKYMDPEDARNVREVYNRVYRTGEPGNINVGTIIRKDGGKCVFESSVQVKLDANGKPVGFRGVHRDVTRRHETEAALRASEEKYRTILETMSEGYFECDLSGNYIFFNEAERRLLGYTRDEMLGMNYRRYMDEHTAAKVKKVYQRVYKTGVPARLEEYALIHKDGTKTMIETSVQLMRDAEGKPTGFRGVSRDVSNRHQAESALRASEEKYRTILESIEDAYYEVDVRGNLVMFNTALCRLLGYPSDELAGMNNRQYTPPHIASSVYQTFNQVYRSGVPTNAYDWTMQRKDGASVCVEGSVHLIKDAQERPIGFRGILRDVTRRKREDQLLALEHAVTRSLADTSSSRKVLRDVMRIVCESEQWQSGGFWSIDERAQALTLVDGWAEPKHQAAVGQFYADAVGITIAMDGLLGHVCKTGEPVWIADTTREPRTAWPERAHRTGEKSCFAFPVLADGKMIGVLGFGSRAMRPPDERFLETANVIGNQIGQYLQRKQAEQVLRDSEARFRALTELSSDWYWEQDAEYRFVRIESRRGDEPMGEHPFLGKRGWETGYQLESQEGWEAHRAILDAHQPYRDLVAHRLLPDGTQRYLSVSGEPVFDAKGRFSGYRGVSRDITQQKLAEERIRYLATHDGLTGIPNRAMFNELLNHALQLARRHERKLAVFFIDLDRFKVINDTLGHEAGDTLLKEMATRLTECLRASDIVARLGGDEFVVLVQDIDETADAVAVARKILSTVMKPMLLAGQECRVTASVGICLYPAEAEDEQSLMKNADMAMYLAKAEGKNNFQFYSKESKTQSLERLMLEINLRHALARNEFSLHYQPKLDLKTGQITGAEALLRWDNPDLGSVSPAQFIPLAEETGFIVPIGKWVLKTACAQNVAWQHAGLPPLCMAVNLSARQFADVNLLSDIAEVLQETGMAPQLLELEITEGMVIPNPERATRLLTAIKNMGIRLAIDDFGTGYSSLGQLKHFPIDTLKVDRSFIREIPGDTEDSAITEAIIVMGKTLGLTVVAEGVETQEQADFLQLHACDEMQGYLFSRPIPADAFGKLLRNHHLAG